VKVADAEFPASSVAVQETTVDPIAKVLPDDGEQATEGSGSALSAAVTEYVTPAP
jgi:hypothetical protein